MCFVRIMSIFSILLSIFLVEIYGYSTKMSFPTWRDSNETTFSMSSAMECKSFIKIVTTIPVKVRYSCQNRKCMSRRDCGKRYLCVGQILQNITRYKQVNVCCPGYITQNNKCVRYCDGQYYGLNCSKPCNCPQNAHRSCDTEFGRCYCLPGWKGKGCNEKCSEGFFGDDCQHKCACANKSHCDHETGKCSCTTPGWRGKYCDKPCPTGSYGINCSKKCYCGGAKNKCHPETGACICPTGFQGQTCEEVCSDGKFGANCSSQCVCDARNTVACDPVTGRCSCQAGWMGITCKQLCTHGRFGENCDQKCDCDATDACDPFSGRCIKRCVCSLEGTENCDDNHDTCNCDQANLHQNCAEGMCTCNSTAKYCVPQTTQCRCKPGWTGFRCDKRITVKAEADVTSQDERRTFDVVAISCICGIVMAVGIVFLVIFCKDRFKRSPAVIGADGDDDVMISDLPIRDGKLYYDSVQLNAIINQGGASLSGSTTELMTAQTELNMEDLMAPHVYHVLEKTGTSFDSLHRKRDKPTESANFAMADTDATDTVSNIYHVLNPHTTVAEINKQSERDQDNPYHVPDHRVPASDHRVPVADHRVPVADQDLFPAPPNIADLDPSQQFPLSLNAQDLYDKWESFFSDSEFDSDSESSFDMNTFIRKDDPIVSDKYDYAVVNKTNLSEGCVNTGDKTSNRSAPVLLNSESSLPNNKRAQILPVSTPVLPNYERAPTLPVSAPVIPDNVVEPLLHDSAPVLPNNESVPTFTLPLEAPVIPDKELIPTLPVSTPVIPDNELTPVLQYNTPVLPIQSDLHARDSDIGIIVPNDNLMTGEAVKHNDNSYTDEDIVSAHMNRRLDLGIENGVSETTNTGVTNDKYGEIWEGSSSAIQEINAKYTSSDTLLISGEINSIIQNKHSATPSDSGTSDQRNRGIDQSNEEIISEEGLNSSGNDLGVSSLSITNDVTNAEKDPVHCLVDSHNTDTTENSLLLNTFSQCANQEKKTWAPESHGDSGVNHALLHNMSINKTEGIEPKSVEPSETVNSIKNERPVHDISLQQSIPCNTMYSDKIVMHNKVDNVCDTKDRSDATDVSSVNSDATAISDNFRFLFEENSSD